MNRTFLERRGLTYYWRTHLAVVAGVVVATAVLAGALLVGESVRSSLQALAFSRLGRTDVLLTATTPFRESLAAALLRPSSQGAPLATAPLFTSQGTVVHDASRRRAMRVAVYGVDDRFWRFHGVAEVTGPTERRAFVSPALASELGASQGDALLVTVEAPSDIPAGVLQGRRDGRSRTVRLELQRVLAAEAMGEFALRPTQAAVMAVFVPLRLLQREVAQPDRANAVLASIASGAKVGLPAVLSTEVGPSGPTTTDVPGLQRVRAAVMAAVDLDDLGVAVRTLDSPPGLAVESRSGFLHPQVVDAVVDLARVHGLTATPVLTYLANRIRIGNREIPYSVVTGIDWDRYPSGGPASAHQPVEPPSSVAPLVWLNEWAADDLNAQSGDRVRLDYFLWSDEAGLRTDSAEFTFAGVVPMVGAGGDRALMPDYPGLTGEGRMADWDPPFPVDLKRVRPVDEAYWDRYRTAPKAFVSLATAQRLWGSQYGQTTSVRLFGREGGALPISADALGRELRPRLDLAVGGISIVPVRAEAEQGSRGTTDFGEYFLYFTFFLVVSALMLTGLLFRLSVEQRLREIGLLRAIGFSIRQVRRHLLREGLVIAVVGSVIGVAAAVGWAELVMTGLRTWWFDAVGTDRLAVHVSWPVLVVGAVAGIATSGITMWRMLSSLAAWPPRTLLGALEAPTSLETPTGASRGRLRRSRLVSSALFVAALSLLAASQRDLVGQVPAFFGAAILTLAASLLWLGAWLQSGARAPVAGAGWWSVARLGFRGPRQRPGRASTAVALIAFATFIVVAVGAFRRDAEVGSTDRASGTGGFALVGEAVVPLMHDPGTSAGREALALPSSDARLTRASFTRVRLRAGDDASCLTLYRPTRPRIAGVPDALLRGDRFRFSDGLGDRTPGWSLLTERLADGAVPAVADANSLAYVFHLSVGDSLTIQDGAGQPVTLRIVGALTDSIFQSELLIAEPQFVRLFPRESGYRMLLVDTPAADAAGVLNVLEERLSDYGLDLQTTGERLAGYHRVENTYISTFQALGALGLLLGTCGVGAMLLRSVLERRRELAVLRAVGYRPSHLSLMVLAESALIAGLGAGAGTLCALVATAPALAAHGGRFLQPGFVLLPLVVLAVALLSSLAAAAVVGRMPVAGTIRSE